MSKFSIGDLVVLKSGSMRMCVEDVTDAGVACVWCHEGVIGRDSFDERLLKAWEHREDDRAGQGASRRPAGGADRRPPRSNERGNDRGNERPERPDRNEERPRPTGWDGKPREKKYFRKEKG